MKQDWIEQIENRMAKLIAIARKLHAENIELRQQITLLEAQPHTETNPIEENEQLQQEIKELKSDYAKLENQLIQEEERFRIEYTLLQNQYESNISRLNQALAMQMQNVRNQTQPSNSQIQELEQLRQQYTDCRRQLIESAALATTLSEQLNHIVGEHS